jgi:hypothetical protein
VSDDERTEAIAWISGVTGLTPEQIHVAITEPPELPPCQP